MMGMMVNCSSVFRGACSENSCGRANAGEYSGRAACPQREAGSCNAQPPQACAAPGEQHGAGPWAQRLRSPPVTPVPTAWSRCGTCRERAAVSRVQGVPPHSPRRPCTPVPPQVQLHTQRLPLQEHLGAQLGLLGREGAQPQPCGATAARLLLLCHGPASPWLWDTGAIPCVWEMLFVCRSPSPACPSPWPCWRAGLQDDLVAPARC